MVLQRYAPHKVVLVDNGSRDGSLEKLRDQWSGQVIHHKVSVTGGVRRSNVLSAGRAYHFARGGMLVWAKHARGPRLVTSVAGQILLRFPFYVAGMLLHDRPRGALLYAGGMIDGLWRYVIRGAGGGPDPAPRS
jgi:hypothetical protein